MRCAALIALWLMYHKAGDGQGGPRRQAFRTVGVVVKRLCGIVQPGDAAAGVVPLNGRCLRTDAQGLRCVVLLALFIVPHAAEAGRIRPNCAARQALLRNRRLRVAALGPVPHAVGATPKQADRG